MTAEPEASFQRAARAFAVAAQGMPVDEPVSPVPAGKPQSPRP